MKKKERNLLDLVPERNCKWEETEPRKITLLRPRYKNPVLRYFVVKFQRSEDFRIHLDDVGSRVWGLIDGLRTIEEIGRHIDKDEKEALQQAYERLAQFFLILKQNKFIRWKAEERVS